MRAIVLTPLPHPRPFIRLHRRALARRYLPGCGCLRSELAHRPSAEPRHNSPLQRGGRGVGEVGVVARLMWQTAAGARDTGTPLRLDIPSEAEGGVGRAGEGGLLRNTPPCQH